MSTGRRAVASQAQRGEVHRLAADAVSVRAIAETVFGNARYRGRVEGILRASAERAKVAAATSSEPEASVEQEPPAVDADAVLQLIRREVARLCTREGNLSVAELASLMRIQRQLEAHEELERLNALTRHRR